MGTIIKEIKIPDSSYSFISDDGRKGNVLKNLSKINIFVGENNSGKSRFLRSIVAKKDFEFIPTDQSFKLLNEGVSDLNLPESNIFEILNNDILELKTNSKSFDRYNRVIKVNPFFNFIKKLDDLKEIFLVQGEGDALNSFMEYKELASSLSLTRGHSTNNVSHGEFGEAYLSIINEHFGHWGDINNMELGFEFIKIYIPILRGLRPLIQGNKTDLYGNRIIDDHFNPSTEDENRIIFTGLDAYDTINKYSRLSPTTRELLDDFKEYLKNNFFDGKKVEITAALKENGEEDVLAVKIGDEHEKPIYELGDGIQSIIILTLPLFLRKNENLLVFIEEPEQFLHPGLQRKLIETLLYEEGFENFQFFFTTHSNHFLDITLDFNNISIFTLKKELDNSDNKEKVPTFTIENLSEGDNSALELLGVRNSSVFLSNCTIWVEGITDRHHLRHYLKLYAEEHKDEPDFKDFKEDYHYSYVEYGGNNITHWSFLDKEEKPINVEKLCGRLFLLADKDQGKEERHEQLKDTLGENRVHILECNEIENLVSPQVLLEIVKDYERIKDGDSLDNLNIEVEYEQYKNELLGDFIESTIIKDIKNKKRKGDYKAESGTINNKDSFLKKSIKYSQNWDDLSEEAQEITERIYNFIRENNS